MDLVSLAALAALVLTSFIATNLDNLLMLVFLLGTERQRPAAVLLGYLTSAFLVITVAALGVAVGALLDPAVIGYLGIAPIAMACYLLYQQYLVTDSEPDKPALAATGEGQIWLTSAVLMFSNSGDSIAVLLPLMAESGRAALLIIVSIYLLSSLLWCGLSVLIASRPGLVGQIQQRGVKLVPWIMIVVGLYVLTDTGTDTLL